MDETYKIIDRSKNSLSLNDWGVLFRLCVRKSWLRPKWSKLEELWAILDSNTEKKLIAFLLRRFIILDAEKERTYYEEIAEYIKTNWVTPEPSKTWIVATCNDKEADGSHVVVDSIKSKFSRVLRKDNILNSYQYLEGKLQNGDTIILCDDFIGSGWTINNRVTKIKEWISESKLENIDFKVISLAAMKFSKELYLDACTSESYSCMWLNKGISDNCKSHIATKHKETMQKIETKLSPSYYDYKLKRYSLGYKQSETLYTRKDMNIPNNVFPVFWWAKLSNGDDFDTLFDRIL